MYRAAGPRHRRAGDVTDEDAGRGTADAAHVVMLREPVAVVAQLLRVACLIAHHVKSLRGVTALANRGQVENRNRNHEGDPLT